MPWSVGYGASFARAVPMKPVGSTSRMARQAELRARVARVGMNQKFFINVTYLKFYKICAVNGIKARRKRLACAWVKECGPARSNMTRS
jgi:hypothetical protein